MPLASSGKRNPRLAVFDLDRALIDSRPAWRYAIEESVISVTGKRVSAGPLVEEYHQRPWRHALGILVRDPEEADRCEALCVEMHGRSAMKRLLVFEGIGMALDALRAERIDMAGVTRLAHRTAMKQVQSTGLDRFLAYVAAPHSGEAFGFEDLFRACCDVLESGPHQAAAIVPGVRDQESVLDAGAVAYCPLWAPGAEPLGIPIAEPADMLAAFQRAWANRP